MLKRILTAVLMLFVLLVVNSAGASNTVRIAYSDIDNFVGIKICCDYTLQINQNFERWWQ